MSIPFKLNHCTTSEMGPDALRPTFFLSKTNIEPKGGVFPELWIMYFTTPDS